MPWFKKSESRNQVEKLEEAIRIKEEESVDKILENIILFPGNKQEFEEFIGYSCRIIDTGLQNKGTYYEHGIYYDYKFKKMLVDKGIIALINIHPENDDYFPYGLPVGKR